MKIGVVVKSVKLAASDPTNLYKSLAAKYAPVEGQDSFEVNDPSTGAFLGSFPTCDTNDIDRVILFAKEAAQEWRSTPNRERGRLLKAAAEVLRDKADEIATIESLEVGKTYLTSRSYDMEVCAQSFEFFGSLIESERGTYFPGVAVDSYSVREPYGLVAGVIPFNWPPIHTGAKLAPALAAGNVVVLKPPEQCPLAVLLIIDAIAHLFPPGVVQAVTGVGAVTGNALISHPGVDRISFTGSPATAKNVLHAAAENFTGALLELGGKNPLLIFPDVDLDLAVLTAVEGAFMNQGQACTAASRLLVHESVVDEFTTRFVAATARLKLGHALDPESDLGPVVTAEHRSRIESYTQIGLSEGATIAYQGTVPVDKELAAGFFVAPLVFAGVTKKMRVAQEEIFGPVVVIMPFSHFDEAIEIANSTSFALVAGVFSGDPITARKASDAIDAGVVFVNNYNRSFLPTTPFGGNRASGYGREHTAETLNEFSRVKSVRSSNGLSPVPLLGFRAATD
ncbi:aldehyde dehydrogenase family protein [Salinibacterium sp. TMP30]|uniref:aldehyde dehydrogenase family protein n=1 Tax=Salinibacterium sp. TMP30 TaxID=3138237 RepID=UPI0031388C74